MASAVCAVSFSTISLASAISSVRESNVALPSLIFASSNSIFFLLVLFRRLCFGDLQITPIFVVVLVLLFRHQAKNHFFGSCCSLYQKDLWHFVQLAQRNVQKTWNALFWIMLFTLSKGPLALRATCSAKRAKDLECTFLAVSRRRLIARLLSGSESCKKDSGDGGSDGFSGASVRTPETFARILMAASMASISPARISDLSSHSVFFHHATFLRVGQALRVCLQIILGVSQFRFGRCQVFLDSSQSLFLFRFCILCCLDGCLASLFCQLICVEFVCFLFGGSNTVIFKFELQLLEQIHDIVGFERVLLFMRLGHAF